MTEKAAESLPDAVQVSFKPAKSIADRLPRLLRVSTPPYSPKRKPVKAKDLKVVKRKKPDIDVNADVWELSAKKMKLQTSLRKKNAADVVTAIEEMLATAKTIHEWTKDYYTTFQDKVRVCHSLVEEAKDREGFKACVESFKEQFGDIEFNDANEEQEVDLVGIYQELDIYRTKRGVDDDKAPTFYKVLYTLGEKIRLGDQRLAKRWPQEDLQRFWTQMY
ncbi:hypothetical protein CBS101457_002676 [Exobasidium rhododendri]|nr:hypothetical protein CBS101457_002676 [Exobasidium rhododendri]